MVSSYRLYGRAMREHFEGNPGTLVIERDDGYRDPSDVQALFAPYRRWPAHERAAIRHAKGHVLDLGCGPGRVALYLQRRGHRVTAVDGSEDALEVARRRGVRDTVLGDGCSPEFPRDAIDTIVMFGNNFGVCGDFAATKRFLRRAHAVCGRGGKLVASSNVPGSWIPRHAAYVKENVRRGRPPGLLRLRIHYGGEVGSWFPLLLVSPDDLLRLCHATDWEVREIFRDREGGTPYAFVAERGSSSGAGRRGVRAQHPLRGAREEPFREG